MTMQEKILDHEIFECGDVSLQCGQVLRGARLAFKTFGTLSPAKDNAIVYPTWYSGQHTENEWLIGDGQALDPEKYFIIIPNMFGNGLSSSPSNTPEPQDRARFPRVTIHDNVVQQHRLVTEHFGIDRLKLVLGWSMGAAQTFQWGALYPDMVHAILPFCGAARCSRHNFVFLEGVKAALSADDAFMNGWYEKKPAKGLRAVGRVYAGWGLSQAFYRQKLDMTALGFSSLEDFLVSYWEGFFLPKDANNLLAMLWTWQNADLSANATFNGDYEAALRAITCRAIVMPGQTDLYFPPEDSEIEVSHMPNAEFRPIPSIWGHFAGSPNLPQEDRNFINGAIGELLE